MAHRGKRITFCFHTLPAPGFDPEALRGRGRFTTEASGPITRLCLDGKDSPFDLAHVYYDGSSNALAVHATGMDNYGALRDLIMPDTVFPEQPFWMSTANMTVAAMKVLKKERPEESFSRAFDEEEPAPEAEEAIKALNAFMREATELSNHGLPVHYEKLAEEHGIPVETARQVERMIVRQEKQFSISLEGGIPGFTPPPPAIRMKMRGPLAESELFVFGSGDRAREQFREHAAGFAGLARTVGKETPGFEEMPAIIDDLSLKHWDTTNSTILTYSLMLLLAAGKEFRPADDYASEILRLFWQVLIPNRGKKSIRRFLESYTSYCEKILAPAGLIETEGGAEGGCRVRRTRFLEEWVRPAM
jgi:hypothetical protein